MQQSSGKEQVKSYTWLLAHHDFIQFIRNAFPADDFDSLGLRRNRFKRHRIDVKGQLIGKSNGSHHAQRIVRKGNIRV